MPKLSRDKGKRGEREVAAIIRSHGFEARRGQQNRGGGDSPDVIHSIPNVYIEVKFREQLNVYDALARVEEEAPLENVSVVFHRRKRTGWVVSMDADEFLKLMENFCFMAREMNMVGYPLVMPKEEDAPEAD